MLLSRFFGRRDVRSSRRPLARRRPLFEDLEGRQLLTAFTVGVAGGNGQTSALVVGNHIGTSALVVGNHIGTSALVVGNHIGTDAVCVGCHIGTNLM
jgi:hypothetical protein